MPISLGTTTITAIFLGTTSITSAYLGATQVFGGSFTPLDLFSGGAQGIWLDPSDLTTMFSDRAGTIQVTTPGTVVGKRLDKSGRGNHATAPTDAARPIYGVEPKGGRRNLQLYTQDFSNAYWSKLGSSITATNVIAPDGTATASTWTGAGTGFVGLQVGSSDTARLAMQTWYVKAATETKCEIWNGGSVSLAQFDLSAVTATNTGGSGAFITAVGNSWYRIGVSSATHAGFVRLLLGHGGPTLSTAMHVWGVQVELGSTASPYQRVTTAYDVTESGVATCHYVQYDGSDDSMSTSAIDFTATDKMSVFAGVRKLSDATRAIVAEISAAAGSNAGSFAAFAPDATGASGNFAFFARGSALGVPTVSSATTLAPASTVMTGLGDISGDLVTLRLNGTQVAQVTGDLGTGNFGNYPLFIGRRNNASLPFNGRDYGLIIVGKAASAGEITDTKTWLAAKTSGVTL